MVQGIIMAGGEGSRLRPLTCDRPKPMVPMLNRPVMEHTVELLKKHNIADIGVTLQYMPQEIINYFRDGSDHEVNIQYFIEDTPLGTAGSVKNSGNFLKDTFVVVSGDALTDFDLTEAIKFHRDKGAIATLVLTPVDIPLEYGVVITEENGTIREFLEKPGWGEVFSDTVNTGIYILEPEVLDYIPQSKKFDFSKDLFPQLLADGRPIFGVSLTGYWCDIGNLKQYQEAHYAAMDGRVSVSVMGNHQADRIFTGEGCQIENTAIITGPAVIGRNCYIGQGARVGPDVVLGDNCRIDEGASVKKSVIWNGSYIGKNAEIRGAVLCERVTVKNRAMVFEGAVVGDNSLLEEDARVKPNNKIWPNKIVEQGTVLSSNLVWSTGACRNLFGADGISGKVHENLTPECAAKLGAVYGITLGRDATVLVSSDLDRCTRMIKMAIQSGLLSVGVSVIDGGDLITPVHRFGVRALEAKGGIHIKCSPAEQEVLHINFFSGLGGAVSRDLERKIENMFERDDFQRNAKKVVGTLSYMPGINESYMQFVSGLANTNVVRNRQFRVAAHFGGKNLQLLLPYIFDNLGCEFLNYGSDVSVENGQELLTVADSMSHVVKETGADFGIVFDVNAEQVALIDDNGKVIDNDMFLALLSSIILDTADKPMIAVPVTGSNVVEVIAGEKKGTVIRTKTSTVAFMNEIMKPELLQGQGQINQAVTAFDGVSTMVTLMNYLAVNKKTLSQLIAGIPEFHMIRKVTGCPWTSKGKVMRRLIEDTKGNRVELLDGVKVYHQNDGWALVLPDAEKPTYHVYSEGYSHEFAESLAEFYIDKINQIKNGE